MNVLLKITRFKTCLTFRTVSRNYKSGNFYISCSEFNKLENNPYLIARDIFNFAEFCYYEESDTLSIRFTWLLNNNEHLSGRNEDITVNYSKLMKFIRENPDNEASYKMLSIDKTDCAPKFVFKDMENLRATVNNPLVRRKLFRVLRDRFRWEDSQVIEFYNDFCPYSFFFREYRNGKVGICGGLILHEQEDMKKAYYSIHT